LKPMATELREGRLRWVLSTAMPVRDEFNVYLNSTKKITPSKEKWQIKRWILGKDVTTLGKLDLKVDIRRELPEADPERYGLIDPLLGRVWGEFAIYDTLLTEGKSSDIRSYGYFVTVNRRLINLDDPYFGIDSNLLRHGTLSRFRMSINIDKLDDELRSSREEVREGPGVKEAQIIMRECFGEARTALDKHFAKQATSSKLSDRVAGTPSSMTSGPIVGLLQRALDGEIRPRHLVVSPAPTKADKDRILDAVQKRLDIKQFVTDTQFHELEREGAFCSYDPEPGTLILNVSHPFVAYFLDEYQDQKRNLPLSLFALAEVVMEARLYQTDLDADSVEDFMRQRDDLLRYAARASGSRNSAVIADALLDAATDKDALEQQLVAAFERMGFDAYPLGKKDKPDGIAEAWLAGGKDGPRSYKISLEAKSKESPGKPVSTAQVGIAAVARHRDDNNCEHAFVLAPEFASTAGEKSTLDREIRANGERTRKTITCMRVVDFADLVRMQPLKRLTPVELQDLFKTCRTPEQSAEWLHKANERSVAAPPFAEVLNTIYKCQRDNNNESVQYPAVQALLREIHGIRLTTPELRAICQALGQMAAPFVFAGKANVEVQIKPDQILESMRSYPGDVIVIQKDKKVDSVRKPSARKKPKG